MRLYILLQNHHAMHLPLTITGILYIKLVIYTLQQLTWKLCEAYFWTKTKKMQEQAQVNLIYKDSDDFKRYM